MMEIESSIYQTNSANIDKSIDPQNSQLSPEKRWLEDEPFFLGGWLLSKFGF